MEADGAAVARELAAVERDASQKETDLASTRLAARRGEERVSLFKKELLTQRLNHLPLFGATCARRPSYLHRVRPATAHCIAGTCVRSPIARADGS